MNPALQHSPPETGLEGLAVLNPEQLGLLQEEGLLETLAPLFSRTASATLDEMATALAAGDAGMLSAHAHRLKGSAVNFGAERFVALCEEIELSSETLAPGPLRRLLDAARAEYRHIEKALEDALKEALGKTSEEKSAPAVKLPDLARS